MGSPEAFEDIELDMTVDQAHKLLDKLTEALCDEAHVKELAKDYKKRRED